MQRFAVILAVAVVCTHMVMADECSSQPCMNGASCTVVNATVTCSCAAGYNGTICQTDINECAAFPCFHGGTCTDGVNSFTCACVTGYSGLQCQTDINECASTICANGGSCVDHVNGWSCACVPGYSGLICQTEINECASNPCANGGSCTDNVNGFTCACPASYHGVACALTNCTFGAYSEFNGRTDSLTVTIGNTFSEGFAVTIAAWLRPNNVSVGHDQYAVFSGSSLLPQNGLLFGYTAASQFVCGVTSSLGPTTATYVSDSGQWHHWTCVISESLPLEGRTKAYRDGALQFTPQPLNIFQTWLGYASLFVGYAPTIGASYAYAGAIDELRIWSRALSTAEVWAGSTANQWSTPALALYIPFTVIAVFGSGNPPLTALYDAASDFEVVVTGSPTYETVSTPIGAGCAQSSVLSLPCNGNGPCGSFGNCSAVTVTPFGSIAECVCVGGYSGELCQAPPAAIGNVTSSSGSGGGVSGGSNNELSSGAVIGIGIAAIAVVAGVVIAAVAYCRYAYKTPILPTNAPGTTASGATSAVLPGIKTLDQLNELNVAAAADIDPSIAAASVEMQTMGVTGATLPSAANALTPANATANASGGRGMSIELSPIAVVPAASASVRPAPLIPPPPMNRTPSDPLPLPAIGRQTSDSIPPIDALPFVRLTSDASQTLPSASPAVSRQSSDQNASTAVTATAAVPGAVGGMAPPPLIRGDSLNAVLMPKRRNRICDKCQSANDEGVAFCSNCGHFFPSAS